MCPKGQQLQYGNYVPKLCVVQHKVFLLLRAQVVRMYVICGERAVNTWERERAQKGKKRVGGKSKGGGRFRPRSEVMCCREG